MENQPKQTCWSCEYHDLDNETFLGKCNYFKTRGKPPKEIPFDIVDVGCKLHKLKSHNG